MRRPLILALALAPLGVGGAAAIAAAQEPQRFTISEHRLEIFDAVGMVTLRRGSGSDIVLTARRAGPDGPSITFGVDRQSDLARFRVVFPIDGVDRIADPRLRSGTRTTIRLRADGTFGGEIGRASCRERVLSCV
jgi:hypothetical protein